MKTLPWHTADFYFLSLASMTVCWPPLETDSTSLPSNCLDLKRKMFLVKIFLSK